MNRRQLIKSLGAALAVPALAKLSADELFAFGHEMHARASSPAAQGLHVFKALDHHQESTLRVLVDRIIPETDTPGAVEAGVPEFIDLMLDEWYPSDQRNSFLGGLAELDARSRGRFGDDFSDCDAQQQVEIMKEQEREAIEMAEEGEASMDWGVASPPIRHFFHRLKWLTLFGYYTSEAGLLGELDWKIMPGAYVGCPAHQGK